MKYDRASVTSGKDPPMNETRDGSCEVKDFTECILFFDFIIIFLFIIIKFYCEFLSFCIKFNSIKTL